MGNPELKPWTCLHHFCQGQLLKDSASQTVMVSSRNADSRFNKTHFQELTLIDRTFVIISSIMKPKGPVIWRRSEC